MAELAVAALTLAVASVLTQTAPANFAGAPAAAAGSLIATGSDFGTTVRVGLEAVPGFPGPNRFTVSLRDYDTGRPVEADRVSLRFAAQDRPDVGASTLALARGRRRRRGRHDRPSARADARHRRDGEGVVR